MVRGSSVRLSHVRNVMCGAVCHAFGGRLADIGFATQDGAAAESMPPTSRITFLTGNCRDALAERGGLAPLNLFVAPRRGFAILECKRRISADIGDAHAA